MRKSVQEAQTPDEVLAEIQKYYNFDPVGFDNNGVPSTSKENQYTNAVLSFAIEEGLTKEQAIDLFRKYLTDGKPHPNIDALRNGSLDKVTFKAPPGQTSLTLKPGVVLNQDVIELINDPNRNTYPFSQVGQEIKEWETAHPDKRKVQRISIGDTSQPIVPAAVKTLHSVADWLLENNPKYGDSEGIPALREAIAQKYEVQPSEVFVDDGIKNTCADLPRLFGAHKGKRNRILVTDPVYPAYVEGNALQGYAGTYDPKTGKYSNIIYPPMNKENGFVPPLPETKESLIIYLCSPNNPTGAAMTYGQLKTWVDYALETGSLIIFDAAYNAFIRDKNVPDSIYRVSPDAKKVAIEMGSLSKTAGFTGIRSGHMIIPNDLKFHGESVNRAYGRLIGACYNGASYLTQQMALAIYSPEGQEQIKKQIEIYQGNVDMIADAFRQIGVETLDGKNAPYVWGIAPENFPGYKSDSDVSKGRQFFRSIINEVQAGLTPGDIFGSQGRDCFRASGLGTRAETEEACNRLLELQGKIR